MAFKQGMQRLGVMVGIVTGAIVSWLVYSALSDKAGARWSRAVMAGEQPHFDLTEQLYLPLFTGLAVGLVAALCVVLVFRASAWVAEGFSKKGSHGE